MASLVPPGLEGKEDVLFGNLNELYSFHNDTFLKDLETCISTTELVALCFVQRVRTTTKSSNLNLRMNFVATRRETFNESDCLKHYFFCECNKLYSSRVSIFRANAKTRFFLLFYLQPQVTLT